MNCSKCGSCVVLLTLAVLSVEADDRVLFDFTGSGAATAWQTVNDGVMGGRSIGRMRILEDEKMQFYVVLSLKNNGGFASIRAKGRQMSFDSGDFIVVKVRGDGRTYKFNLYADRSLRGFSYRQSFQTKKNEWIEVRFPLNRFVATWRGRVYSGQKLDPRKVTGVGFLLGDKRPGPFKLEVDWIKAVDGAHDTTL